MWTEMIRSVLIVWNFQLTVVKSREESEQQRQSSARWKMFHLANKRN